MPGERKTLGRSSGNPVIDQVVGELLRTLGSVSMGFLTYLPSWLMGSFGICVAAF